MTETLSHDCVKEVDECKLKDISEAEASLVRFVCAIDNDNGLELLGTNTVDDKEVFIVKNHTVAVDMLGHCIEVDVDEVIKVATTKDRAQGFIDAFKGDRNDVVMKGYTRIVGYYSGVDNWNSSKIGELRDRAKGNYGAPSFKGGNQDERLSYIDNH